MNVSKLAALLIVVSCVFPLAAASVGDDVKVEENVRYWLAFAKKIAAEPVLVAAVARQNDKLPEEYADMDQIKWAALADLDPLVVALTKSPAAEAVKARINANVSEVFVSDKDGRKVAFLAKTTNWSHEGKPKHELPMKGKVWKGHLEQDQSTGKLQIQVAVPVLKDGQPIGSLVLGVEFAAVGAK